jgi:hypothetical protein
MGLIVVNMGVKYGTCVFSQSLFIQIWRSCPEQIMYGIVSGIVCGDLGSQRGLASVGLDSYYMN